MTKKNITRWRKGVQISLNCEVRYRMPNKSVRPMPIREAARMDLEQTIPFRQFPNHRDQENMPGLYWFATTGRHVFYESRLEMRILTMLDFDPSVVGVFAQPFELAFIGKKWPTKETEKKAKVTRHVPDIFVRRLESPDLVVDVKPAHRAGKLEARRVFDLTRKACAEAGWDYEVATEPDPTLYANIEWLAGYRRPPTMVDDLAECILDTIGTLRAARSGERLSLGELLAGLVSDCPSSNLPEAVYRPVVYHLLWTRVLSVDLSEPLSDASVVRPAMAAAGRKP